MSGYYFLMDVGGTTIKVNCLNEKREPLFVVNREFPAQSQRDQETILNNFQQIIVSINQEILAQGYQLLGVGLAFPGPFNYQEGYSLMQGMRKYDGIYGINLKALIREWLRVDFQLEVPIVFENDATSFGLGEYHQRHGQEGGRGIYLTLGTGCGSAFIVDGQLIRQADGLNDQGMLFDHPFKESRIDDYLSANGLSLLAKKYFPEGLTGYELFLKSEQGNPHALSVFKEFGQWIGEALGPFVVSFKPDELVFGGEISGSLPYFYPSLVNKIGDLVIRKSQNTSLATLQGLVTLIVANKKPSRDIL